MIFISYAREDTTLASLLQDRLETCGWTVWLDCELIAGDKWWDVVWTKLQRAQCVLGLWSDKASTSQWVFTEMSYGYSQHKLLPVVLGTIRLPPEFAGIQSVSLPHTKLGFGTQELRKLFGALTTFDLPPLKLVQQHQLPSFKEQTEDAQDIRVILITGKTFWRENESMMTNWTNKNLKILLVDPNSEALEMWNSDLLKPNLGAAQQAKNVGASLVGLKNKQNQMNVEVKMLNFIPPFTMSWAMYKFRRGASIWCGVVGLLTQRIEAGDRPYLCLLDKVHAPYEERFRSQWDALWNRGTPWR